MLRVTVDKELCAGSGRCEVTYPAAFEVGDDMKARLRPGVDMASLDRTSLLEAARACPWGAIAVDGENIDDRSHS